MTRRNLARRGWAIAPLLGVFVFLAAQGAIAGVFRSRHDFDTGFPTTTTIPRKFGRCSVCHVPHRGDPAFMLWPRSLSEERSYYTQTNNPNYVPGSTLMCYDCHDDAAAADNDPLPGVWATSNKPQDVAFTDGPPSRGGTKVGYYEMITAVVPGGGNVPPIDGSPTGGHYWKTEPTGTPDFARGDKIWCEMCHDPHNALTGNNEGFFRYETPNGSGGMVTLGNNHKVSSNKLNPPTTTENGRSMCAACHSYSNSGSAVTLYGVTVPKPPTTMPQHLVTDTTPCTNCHPHNKVFASCRECHGWPPLQTQAQAGGLFDKNLRPDAENYPGGAGAHQRHKDVLGDAIFKCELCHGPNAGSASWHNQGNGIILQTFPAGAANVDVMGLSAYWDPNGTRAASYTGLASGVALQPGYEFSAKGGGDQRCATLACHGNPPNTVGALNWTDKMVNDATGAFVGDGDMICAWCHGASSPAAPAVIDFGTGPIVAPNVMGSGSTWGAEVNGHGLPATSRYDQGAVGDGLGKNGAGKECVVCHDATYRVNASPPPAPVYVPNKTHFDSANDSAEKRLWSGAHQVNGQTISATATVAPDQLCVACHQNAGGDAGTQLSHHGNDPASGYLRLEGAFTRVCRQCHNVHGANWNGTGRNLYMVGSWVDADHDGVAETGADEARVDSNATNATTSITAADNKVIFTSRTGANSFDTNNGLPNQNICRTCHAAATGGGLHDGTPSSFDMRGQDCTQCHDHDYDEVPSTADAFMPSSCGFCHGEDCNVSKGLDNVPCTSDDAPNVVSAVVGGVCLSVYNGTWWDTQQGGNSATQQGGHGDPDGVENGNASLTPTCLSCHNTSDGTGAHLNGVYNSVGSELPRIQQASPPTLCADPTPRPKGNANTNTSHLLPAYFTKYPANGGGDYRYQVAMDNFCYRECHQSNSVPDMRHEKDTAPADANHWSVELGTHLTGTTPSISMIDADLTTNAGGTPNYAPCASCHNPHGSTNTDTKGSGGGAKNRMMINTYPTNLDWSKGVGLCINCHNQ